MSATRTMAVALAIVMVAGVALAQGQQQQPQAQMQQQMGKTYQPTLKQAGQLIGMKVQNSQGKELGNLSEIVLEPNLNYVSYGVLSSGGFVGIGESQYAIPWDMFQLGPDRETLILDIPEQALEQAQGFSKNQWPDRADQRWRMLAMGRTQRPMGRQQPQQQGQTWREQQWQEQQQWRKQPQQQEPQAMRQQRRQQDQQLYGRPEQQQPQTTPQQQQQQQRRRQQHQQRRTYGGEKGFEARRLSKLLDMDVQTFTQQEDLGNLQDILLDFHQGLVAYGVVSLGSGELAAVPWSAIEIRPSEMLALIDTDRQSLQQVAFSEDQMPDLSNPQYAQQLHNQFNRQPYWEVLGFVGAGAQMRPQQMRPQQMQQQQEPLTRHFDPQNVTMLTGTVQEIGMFDEPQLGIQGRKLTITTQDGQTVVVHAGPSQFLEQQGLTLQKNDQVQVRGSFAQINGQTVFIASDIRTRQNTVKLRNQQGVPVWRGQGMGRGQGMRRGMGRQQQQQD